MNQYDIDTTVVITSSPPFQAPNGTPVDPSTVTLYLTPPAGPQVTLTGAQLTRLGVGVYAYSVLANASGVWLYQWQGLVGTIEVTGPEIPFKVRLSTLIPG